MITVTAELDAGHDLGSVNRALQRALGRFEGSVGISLGIGRQLSCAARIVRQSGDGAGAGGGGLVFLLLGFQFHSLTLPVLIFLAQPVSLASALFALDHGTPSMFRRSWVRSC